ncbi:hypothetical protein K490DRAFT_56650 [Saccharata proteae CBS 121410]|uniref:Uncharacterized protein n=1 Tax=Saccharata proteae CBS 121410 TaxID=1314787 RepID=A0A9P4HXV0_9PEZI|nr:hypothetical protein K490DRAFT_56650 [Saccharata proteae CBS 121410]
MFLKFERDDGPIFIGGGQQPTTTGPEAEERAWAAAVREQATQEETQQPIRVEEQRMDEPNRGSIRGMFKLWVLMTFASMVPVWLRILVVVFRWLFAREVPHGEL